MKIAVIGASGWLGGAIAREAVSRGHEVTAIGRDAARLSQVEGARAVVADLDDPEPIVDAVRGSDVVVSSVTDRSTADRSRIPATARQLLDLAPRAGVHRVAFVGGGGSLEIGPGLRAVDAPGFPEQHKAEALAQAEALEVLRGSDGGVDWTYMSPPPHHLVPGEKTSGYQVRGGDRPVINAAGESRITAGDFAAAFVDELEASRFSRQRFTAGS
jgi:putative NADH-flavin reductase